MLQVGIFEPGLRLHVRHVLSLPLGTIAAARPVTAARSCDNASALNKPTHLTQPVLDTCISSLFSARSLLISHR